MKKTLSLILTFTLLLMTFSVFTISAATSADTKIVSVDGVEKTLSEFVTEAATNDYSGKALTLLTDVVLEGEWASIPSFAGTLDGNGKSISGLTAPLFTKLNGATVKNLTLNGSITMEANQCGAFAAQSEGVVTLENCVSNVDIAFTQTGSSASVGGLIGFAKGNVNALNCINNGDITASSANKISVDVGGIVGWTEKNAEFTATACINNGDLTCNVVSADGKTSNTSIIGGMIGWGHYNATFTKCVNTGTIKTASVVAAGGHKLGGLAGVIQGGTFTFDSCVNYGEVIAYRYGGGLIGQVEPKLEMKNCYNYGAITTGGDTTTSTNSYAGGLISYLNAGDGANIEGCTNYGAIVATPNKNTDVCAGGLISMVVSALNMTGCENRGTVSSETVSGGIIGCVNKDGKEINVNNCYSAGVVTLPQTPQEGALAGALVAKISKGTVSLSTSRYLNGVNAIAFNGTVTDVADTVYTVENEAAWRALQAINYEGLQYTAAADGKFDLRLVASLSSLDYLNAGYEVIRVVDGGIGAIDAEIKTVYKSLTGFDAEGTKVEYQATEFGAEYLAALVIKNVPADRNVTFIVRPYVMNTEGTAVSYGDAFTLTFENGALVK